MRYPPFQELLTSRLRLRKIRLTDAEPFYTQLGGSGAVTKYMLFQPHQSPEESRASIEKWLSRYETGKCYHWAIARKDSDELIGVIDLLRFDETANSCSFAYMLAEACWNQGYGTEAVRAVFDFAFREMELSCIEADHMEENGASGAVMRKCGMVYKRTEPEKYEKCGRKHNAVVYGISRREWMQSVELAV